MVSLVVSGTGWGHGLCLGQGGVMGCVWDRWGGHGLCLE